MSGVQAKDAERVIETVDKNTIELYGYWMDDIRFADSEQIS